MAVRVHSSLAHSSAAHLAAIQREVISVRVERVILERRIRLPQVQITARCGLVHYAVGVGLDMGTAGRVLARFWH
jgi:hypothetical protein